MKLLTFIVPCYNSESYMKRALDTLLELNPKDVEIIIVNDGSTDATSAIGEEYRDQHPHVRLIDKPNGGHGSAIMAGLSQASGEYIKVIDSDDWVLPSAVKTLLSRMKVDLENQSLPDLYLHNFVYEHHYTDTQYVRSYRDKLPVNTLFSWEQIKPFRCSETLLMHAMVYRREVLNESGMSLPSHTFYVDNLFAYVPLPYVTSMVYLDVDLYRYFIGRDDQSVHIKNFSRRYDQQAHVMYELLGAYTSDTLYTLDPKLRKYMLHNLSVILIVTQMFAVSGNTEESRWIMTSLWKNLKHKDARLYRKLRYRSLAVLVNLLPWPLRRITMRTGYKIAKRRLKIG